MTEDSHRIRMGLSPAAAVAMCAVGLFLVVTAIGFVRRPAAFHAFAEGRLQWDAAHYHTIATEGYLLRDPAIGAFAPLWPMVMKAMLPDPWIRGTGLASSILAFVLFSGSLYLLAMRLAQIVPPAVMAVTVFAFALNPMSLFHAQPYAESLFSLWAALLLWCLPVTDEEYEGFRSWRLAAIGVLSVLLCLTRNVGLQVAVSACAATLLAPIAGAGPPLLRLRRHGEITGALIAGAVVSLVALGVYNAKHYGDFFYAFSVQGHWEQKLGLDLDMLLRPGTWTVSFKVLVWDLIGFYVPIVVYLIPFLVWLHRTVGRNGAAQPTGGASLRLGYVFWFSTSFAGCHSAIVLLSRPDFHAMARYTFAVPFIFVALAMLCRGMPRKTLLWIWVPWIVVSAVYLANWWGRYGREVWYG